MADMVFPFVRLIILVASFFTIWLIARRPWLLVRQAISGRRSLNGWPTSTVVFLVSVSLLYSSTIAILSTLSSGIRALLFPASLLYKGAPWIRLLFVGNLFWLLVAIWLIWFFMRQFQARTNTRTWPLSHLETLSLYTVTTATLAEIIGQGQNLLVDILGSSLSSKAPSDLEAVSFYLFVGNVFFAVILVCIVWMVHRSWSKE